MVPPVGKISRMKFLLSCTSSRWDLSWLIKYYRPEVQLAYLVNFAQLLCWFLSYFTCSAFGISLTLLCFIFQEYVYIYLDLIWS